MARRVGYGRPGTPVIPSQWVADHEPIADATHGCAVTLRHAAGDADGFDWDTKRTDPARGPAYASNVTATITAEQSRADTDVTTGEERIETSLYRVAVSNLHACLEDDVVEVIAAPDDPLLVGRRLRVEQVLLGAGRFERDLLCVLLPAAAPTDD